MNRQTNGPARARIPSLDGLRAFSIIFVIIGHLAGLWSPTRVLATLGVQVFFVLSGYLITTLLQNEHESAGRIDLRAFYWRRSFRIFPAAFAYIGLVAILAPAARPDLVYALTYTVSYHIKPVSFLLAHLWSVSVEEQFYLLWPVALVFGFRYRGRIAVATMLVAALFRLECTVTGSEHTPRLLHFYFFGVMDSIAAGCLLAIYWTRVRARCEWLASHAGIAAILPVATWVLAFAFWRDTFPGGTTVATPKLAVFWGFVPVLIGLCTFVAIKRRDWILNNPFVSGIGTLSYSLYLWQEPFTIGHAGSITSNLLMVAAFAFLSYALIEKPMLEFGRKIRGLEAVC